MVTVISLNKSNKIVHLVPVNDEYQNLIYTTIEPNVVIKFSNDQSSEKITDLLKILYITNNLLIEKS